jgi:hypothetical protein
MTVLISLYKANFIGNVHGGDLLKLLDQADHFRQQKPPEGGFCFNSEHLLFILIGKFLSGFDLDP